jgi:hypothetical protein
VGVNSGHDDLAPALPESQETHSSDTPRSRVAFLRHPLLVGAAVAVIGAFFASLLIPSITQVTQDRPKELDLKRGIVERIAGATGTAWHKGIAIARGDRVAAGGQPDQPMPSVFRQVSTDWDVEASAVDGEITTYFGHGDTWRNWRTLRESTKRFLELTSVHAPNTRMNNATYLCSNLGAYVTSPKRRRELRNHCKKRLKKHRLVDDLVDEKSFSNVAFGLTLDLEDVRDAVTLDIVETPAAGFRHSPWSLG